MSKRPQVKAKGVITIDAELCKGCGYCVAACPRDAITIGASFNSSGYFPAVFSSPERCTGCASCARLCPDLAVEVWVEDF